ncbi:TPA: restriction endonuclease subunit S [Clostridium perfringens]
MNRNVPKLRFKGFEDEWRKGKLGDMSKIIMGQSPSSNAYNYNKEGLPLVQGNADITKRITTPRMYTTEITKTCEIEDIIMSVRAPVGSIAIAKQRSCIGRGVCSIKAIGINQKYLYQVLLGYEKKWLKISQGSTFESINSNDIKGVMLNIPSLQEQEKIANFLSKVDSIIEKQERKVEYWNSYKKGMMQKIFSQKIRFKDEKGRDYPEWENVNFSKITKKTGVRNKENKEFRVYSISNKYGFIPQDEQFESSRLESLDKSAYKIVENGDFAYNPARINVGSIGLLEDEIGIVSSLYVCFRFIKNMDNKFFKYYFSTYEFNKNVLRNVEGGVRDYLFYDNFIKIKVKVPCIEEQEKIANFLSNIDNIIDKESEKLEELKQWKKGLLQQMFV